MNLKQKDKYCFYIEVYKDGKRYMYTVAGGDTIKEGIENAVEVMNEENEKIQNAIHNELLSSIDKYVECFIDEDVKDTALIKNKVIEVLDKYKESLTKK